ncbi:g1401 [Coccomyxa viridis]|uniref:G1401 protein n=1 Tax=Coccomyxa viridis TaxID=1274662 RepID=A0ABP1FNC0_9CHLO
MQDIGVSHYYVVVKSQNGDLMQWEFGPVGGDSTLGRKAEATAAGLLRNPFVRDGKQRRQPAEIREAKVTELPPKHMYVGKTHLSVNDIRSFNNIQRLVYELNENDCRHYVDRICRYTTGVNAATALCKRHVYNLGRQQAQWSDSLVTVAQILTDVANWPRVKAATQMSLAFAGAWTSRAMFSRLSPQLLPRVQPLSLAVPAPRTVVQRTLQRRPIAMATAVGAAYTAGRAPVVQDVGSRMGDGLRGMAMNLCASTAMMGQSAIRGLTCGAQEVITVAGNALSSGSAGPRGMLQRGTALQAAPRFRTRLALPQLRFPGRRQAALVTT